MAIDKTGDDYCVAETRFGSIQYVEIGPRDGAVILFSTGGGAGYSSVRAFRWLAERGYRVIAINRPGYFDLPVDVVDTIEGHADIYHEVIETLGVTGAINVFGVSMGGLSALYYAEKYRTKASVLWSAVTGPYVVNQEAARFPLGKLVLSDSGKKVVSWLLLASAKFFPEFTIQEFLKTEADLNSERRKAIAKQVVSDPNSKEEFMIFVKSMTPMGSLYAGMMDEVDKATMLDNTDWTGISCPTLAVHSPIDIDVTVDHARRLEESIPNIQIEYIEAAGHFVWWGEDGKRVKHLTLRFFDRFNRQEADR